MSIGKADSNPKGGVGKLEVGGRHIVGCRGGGHPPVRHKVCDDDLVDGDDEPDESLISDSTNKHHVRRCPTDALGRGYRHTVGRDLTSVHTRGKHIHIFI